MKIQYRSFAVFALIVTTFSLGCRMSNEAALVDAIAQGNRARIDELLTKELNLNAGDSNGVTPLLQSLISEDARTYQQLLERGASPNVCAKDGRCVMNEAAEHADISWLELALKHGGNPDARNTGNRHYPDSTPLLYAVSANRIENVRILLNAGASINHSDERHHTPLLDAVYAGSYEIAFVLLEAGADPLQTDQFGESAVSYIADSYHRKAVHADQQVWLDRIIKIFDEKFPQSKPKE